MTPTAGRLWKRMTFEQRHRAARAFWRDDDVGLKLASRPYVGSIATRGRE